MLPVVTGPPDCTQLKYVLYEDMSPCTSSIMVAYIYGKSLVECYNMVLAVIMYEPENVLDECYWIYIGYLHKCYRDYWLLLCKVTQLFTPI